MSTCSKLCIVSRYGQDGYAIPVQYIERCILVSITDLMQQTICVDGEDVPLIMLCDRSFSDGTKDLDAVCVLCKRETGESVAVCMGNTLHGYPLYLAELPICNPMEDAEKGQNGNELENGFYTIEQALPNGRCLSILLQHKRDAIRNV